MAFIYTEGKDQEQPKSTTVRVIETIAVHRTHIKLHLKYSCLNAHASLRLKPGKHKGSADLLNS